MNWNHLTGRPAVVGFFMAYVVDALTGVGVVGQTGPIPSSPYNITSLREIDLSRNDLGLPIPEWLFNHKDLTNLNLGYNHFGGPIPGGIVNMTSLSFLDISHNQFIGTLPETIGQLKMLTVLDISYNSFEGVVSEVHFAHLASLEYFIARASSFTLKTRQGWFPPSNLRTLALDSWHLGPEFPMWLQRQTQLLGLSLSNTGISATIPTWFSNISSHLWFCLPLLL
ncbi:hypothetical protein M0R45_037743 [Rubus argutus]|uniref:Uncharacterized protein n=1 Tax=Rubus argutus TaxID=59490 RepID=A0AAW1W026_RUBAR